MSIKSLCSIHEIYVYEVRETSGEAMGVKRMLAKIATKKCRVIPLVANQITQLGNNQGVVITHRIRFYFDPQIAEKHWIKWRDTIMRPRGIAYDAHGLGRMWQLNADAHTWQKENINVGIE